MHIFADESGLDPREQLDRDWTLFRAAEDGLDGETLRFWLTERPVVVLGRSGRIDEDVDNDACTADDVPILHRCSGGGAVVVGPGCLNYAVVLSLVQRPELTDVTRSYQIVLGKLVDGLAIAGLAVCGTSDIALGARKVSGNAQRRGRRAVLLHGTLLFAFDASLARRYLREPVRQPAYRARRPHAEFLGNLPLAEHVIRSRIVDALTR